MSTTVKKKEPLNGKFDRKLFAQSIIDKRTKDQLTLEDMAKQVKLNRSTCFRMELGESSRIETILVLCNWMQKNITYFLTKK